MNAAPFSWIEKGDSRSDPNHFEGAGTAQTIAFYGRSGFLRPTGWTASRAWLESRNPQAEIAAMLMIINTTA